MEQQDLAASPAVGGVGEVKKAKVERNKQKGNQGDGNKKTSQMRGQVEGEGVMEINVQSAEGDDGSVDCWEGGGGEGEKGNKTVIAAPLLRQSNRRSHPLLPLCHDDIDQPAPPPHTPPPLPPHTHTQLPQLLHLLFPSACDGAISPSLL